MSVSRRGSTSLESVHCSRCAAATPVTSWHDPRCVYCLMPLQVPPEVACRAHEHEQVIAAYREEALRAAWRLTPDLPTFAQAIAFLQVVLVGGGASWWCWIVYPQGGPTLLQLPLLASLALGPLLFLVIVRNMAIDERLVATADHSFARLEVLADPTGCSIQLSCSNCGAPLSDSTLGGVTIDCGHCRGTLLSPGFLVRDSQQRFFRRILALRGQLESKIEAPSLLAYGLALLHVGGFLAWGFLQVEIGTFGYLTEGLASLFGCSVCLSFFWLVNQGAKDSFWASVAASIGLPLCPLSATFFYFLAASNGTPWN